MAFEILEEVISSSKTGRPARIALLVPPATKNKSAVKPSCRIFVSNALCDQIEGITARDRFNLLIGTGDDKGVIRLYRRPDGVLSPTIRNSGVYFYCGYVHQFGDTAQRSQGCAAEVIADEVDDIIEIVLPNWAGR